MKGLKGESKGLFGFTFFITQFLSFNFHHSSLNFSHLFGIITQFLSLNIFYTIYGPIPVSRYSFFFFSVPKLTEAKKELKTELVGKKKKKKPELKTNRPNQ